jgi:hypothetical protein
MNNSTYRWSDGKSSNDDILSLSGKYEAKSEKELYFLVSVGPKKCDRRKMKVEVCPEMEQMLEWIYAGLLNELSAVDDEFMAWFFAEKKPKIPKKPLQHMLFQVVPSSAEMLLVAFGSVGAREIAEAYNLDYFRWEPLLLFPEQVVDWVHLYFDHTDLAMLRVTQEFFEKHSEADDEVTRSLIIMENHIGHHPEQRMHG